MPRRARLRPSHGHRRCASCGASRSTTRAGRLGRIAGRARAHRAPRMPESGARARGSGRCFDTRTVSSARASKPSATSGGSSVTRVANAFTSARLRRQRDDGRTPVDVQQRRVSARPVRSARRALAPDSRGGRRRVRNRPPSSRLRATQRRSDDRAPTGAAAARARALRALTMLPGIDGHLISSAFLEQQLPAILESADAGRARRELVAWRGRCGDARPFLDAAHDPCSRPRRSSPRWASNPRPTD